MTSRSQIEQLTAPADRQGRRTGELADIVVSLLVHESTKRDPEFQELVGRLVREL